MITNRTPKAQRLLESFHWACASTPLLSADHEMYNSNNGEFVFYMFQTSSETKLNYQLDMKITTLYLIIPDCTSKELEFRVTFTLIPD